jgi:hypothetical protein
MGRRMTGIVRGDHLAAKAAFQFIDFHLISFQIKVGGPNGAVWATTYNQPIQAASSEKPRESLTKAQKS